MKFKTDENLPMSASAALRELGFHVETVRDEQLSGADDQTVAARARDEERVLLTLDLDFANIHAYPPGRHPGIIVLRPGSQDKGTIVAHVRRLAAALGRRDPRRGVVDR